MQQGRRLHKQSQTTWSDSCKKQTRNIRRISRCFRDPQKNTFGIWQDK